MLFNILRRRITADCGHKTKIVDRVTAYGTSIQTQLPVRGGKTPYCHRCLEDMAVRCAWCGGVVFIGDPVTLYTPVDVDFIKSDYAVIYSENPLRLVGCTRRSCTDTAADLAGVWFPPGKVKRLPTAYEMSLNDLSKGGTGVILFTSSSKE